MEWKVYWHYRFRTIIMELIGNISNLKRTSPERLKGHPYVRLYVALVDTMTRIEQDPKLPCYYLGNTMGAEHRDWRRAKDGLPDRYRLFFKFFSSYQEIFFAWVNDEKTLRKEGAKTDCYAVFRRMLEKGQIPSDHATFLAQSVGKESTGAGFTVARN